VAKRILTPLCALCGIRPATTVEHVPARSLFPAPRPSDLITVPACAPCNNGSQPNDDYFRDTIALIVETDPSAALEQVRKTVERALQRPQEIRLRKHFHERIEFAPLHGRLIHQPVIKPDSKRLNDTVAKHALGLYYEMMREPLPPEYGTVVLPVRWLDKIVQEDVPTWHKVIHWALTGGKRSIGGGVFRFAFNHAVDNKYAFVAVLMYYDNFIYAVRSFPLTATEAR
jgi:hypothetical protein